jgi:hypothetical protein
VVRRDGVEAEQLADHGRPAAAGRPGHSASDVDVLGSQQEGRDDARHGVVEQLLGRGHVGVALGGRGRRRYLEGLGRLQPLGALGGQVPGLVLNLVGGLL